MAGRHKRHECVLYASFYSSRASASNDSEIRTDLPGILSKWGQPKTNHDTIGRKLFGHSHWRPSHFESICCGRNPASAHANESSREDQYPATQSKKGSRSPPCCHRPDYRSRCEMIAAQKEVGDLLLE